MSQLHHEARQIIDTILQDNEFFTPFLELCHYLTKVPFSRTNLLNFATTQIAKLPNTRRTHLSPFIIRNPLTLQNLFPTFTNYVHLTNPSESTEAVLLAYSSYTVLVNTFAYVSFYIRPDAHLTPQVLTYPFTTIYCLIHAVHLFMNQTPFIMNPDIDTVPLLSDWIQDLETAIAGVSFPQDTYTPAIFQLITYPTDSVLSYPFLPLHDVHPSTHTAILKTTHPMIAHIIGTLRQDTCRILYKCELICKHPPKALFDQDPPSDAYYRVTLDLSRQFAQSLSDDPPIRTHIYQARQAQLIQALPLELRCRILNYYFESTSTDTVSTPPRHRSSATHHSLIRSAFIHMDSPIRTTSAFHIEFFVHTRTSTDPLRSPSTQRTRHKEVIPDVQFTYIRSPSHPANKELHSPSSPPSPVRPSPSPECSKHTLHLRSLNWIS